MNRDGVIPFMIFISFIFIHTLAYASDPLKQLSDIQKKLKKEMEIVEQTKRREENLQERLKRLLASIKRQEEELRRVENEKRKTESEISRINTEIHELTNRLSERIQRLERYIIGLYKGKHEVRALLLLSSVDYQDLMKKSKYLTLAAYSENKIIREYSGDIKELLNKKERLKSLQETLEYQIKEIKNRKYRLQRNIEKKDTLLALIKKKRMEKEREIERLREASMRLQEMLKNIKVKKIPSSILGKGFPSLKGHLPWPVNGRVIKNYGDFKKEFNKDGIVIRTDGSERVKAVAGGRVVYADTFPGYGKIVIIDHGNGYHTLYGNLSEFSINKGDLIIEGIEIGTLSLFRDGKYGDLYFEIRYKGRPIDPQKWFSPPRRRGG